MYNEKNRLILTATLIYRLIFIYGETFLKKGFPPYPFLKSFLADFFSYRARSVLLQGFFYFKRALYEKK